MSIVTFADIWGKNRIPNKLFIVGIVPFVVRNVSVNGVSLPSFSERAFYNSTDCLNLSEKNLDWFPFFGDIKTAEHFMGSLNTYFKTSPGRDAGIIFNTPKNRISIYAYDDDLPSHYHIVSVGDFSLTLLKLRNRIIKNERFIKNSKIIEDIVPNNPKLGEDVSLNWDYSGMTPFKNFNPELVDRVYGVFSRIYQHPMSELISINGAVYASKDKI